MPLKKKLAPNSIKPPCESGLTPVRTERSQEHYDQMMHKRTLNYLKRKAKALGYRIEPLEAQHA